MLKIEKNHLIQKRNILNEFHYDMSSNIMNLQELRFFSIYLSKINSRDIKTRVVSFSLYDFQNIMGLDSNIKIEYMTKVTDNLLCKVVNVSDGKGGYNGFQLFSECTVGQDTKGEWYVKIDAHDKALPLMFEFKSHFFSYQLWNALRLKSTNQLRMYELLKQYEKKGSRIFRIDELKDLLGIKKSEYKDRFDNFKKKVLDGCQQALKETTDIKFNYEPYGRRGKGGKFLFLRFTIEKNIDYKEPLSLSSFIEKQRTSQVNKGQANLDSQYIYTREDLGPSDIEPKYRDKIKLLIEACSDEFSFSEAIVLFDDMKTKLPYSMIRDSLQCYIYLLHKYNELALQSKKTKINYRFSYLRTMIKNDDNPRAVLSL